MSVVITSIGRDELRPVIDAVRRQTLPPREIIVVDDRADTTAAELVAESREGGIHVRTLRTGGQGANVARNTGIRAAVGDVIALLDDDDFWEPQKLARQVAVLEDTAGTGAGLDAVFCQFVNDATGTVLPAYPLDPAIPFEQWLFCPPAIRTPRLAAAQTSGIAFRAEVRDRLEFDEALASHQDWDWVIRFTRLPGARLTLLEEPLYRLGQTASNKLSRVPRLEHQLAWALRRLGPSRRALFGYLWMWTIPQAVAARSWRFAAHAVRLSLARGRFDAASFVQGARIVYDAALRRGPFRRS